MTRLAIEGGQPAVAHPLRPYNSIGPEEVVMATAAIRSGPLSGYLGGSLTGGLRVEALEYEWSQIFRVKHSIAVNSATSGLLAACVACGVKPGDYVAVPALTMSGTAAVPAFLGANILFGDIEDKTFGLSEIQPSPKKIKAMIVVNLFGHPAGLKKARKLADDMGYYLIEDNAQATGSVEDGQFAGTIGHIGVWSLNCHKMIQAGEGGICTTDDDNLANRMRLFRNHGELANAE